MTGFSAHWRAGSARTLLLAGLVGSSLAGTGAPLPLSQLLREAESANPELAAAQARVVAAEARISQAAALDDPMAEVGVVNVPLSPWSLRREDMTMQMIGLSQRFPFPGKRTLRREVAASDASSLLAAAGDTRDQILREITMNYEELAATDAELGVVTSLYAAVEDYLNVAEARFAVGSASQSDVLQAESQRTRLRQQQLELHRRRIEWQAALGRLTGRNSNSEAIVAMTQRLRAPPPTLADLIANSRKRPRAVSLAADSARARKQIDLARREYFPDVDIKLNYGRRERALDNMPRDDMVSLTVGVNLPIWRKQRLQPQVAEARAMLAEKEAMLRGLQLETVSELTKRHAVATQARRSVTLYDTELLPAAEATVDSALAAYRVGRVDFLTLLETRMRLFEAQMSRISAVSEHNRALADIDYLAGRSWLGQEGVP